MESEYESLRRYASGYPDTEKMMDVAYKFYHLGKKLDGLDSCVRQQYNSSMQFLYDAIVDGLEIGGVSEVLIDIHDALIQKAVAGEDENSSALLCIVSAIGADEEDIILKKGACFEKHPLLDEEHYYGFLMAAAKKSLETYYQCRCMDDIILECFTTYAFLAGQGMPIEDAIRNRHDTVQQYVSNIDQGPWMGPLCLN